MTPSKSMNLRELLQTALDGRLTDDALARLGLGLEAFGLGNLAEALCCQRIEEGNELFTRWARVVERGDSGLIAELTTPEHKTAKIEFDAVDGDRIAARLLDGPRGLILCGVWPLEAGRHSFDAPMAFEFPLFSQWIEEPNEFELSWAAAGERPDLPAWKVIADAGLVVIPSRTFSGDRLLDVELVVKECHGDQLVGEFRFLDRHRFPLEERAFLSLTTRRILKPKKIPSSAEFSPEMARVRQALGGENLRSARWSVVVPDHLPDVHYLGFQFRPCTAREAVELAGSPLPLVFTKENDGRYYIERQKFELGLHGKSFDALYGFPLTARQVETVTERLLEAGRDQGFTASGDGDQNDMAFSNVVVGAFGGNDNDLLAEETRRPDTRRVVQGAVKHVRQQDHEDRVTNFGLHNPKKKRRVDDSDGVTELMVDRRVNLKSEQQRIELLDALKKLLADDGLKAKKLGFCELFLMDLPRTVKDAAEESGLDPRTAKACLEKLVDYLRDLNNDSGN